MAIRRFSQFTIALEDDKLPPAVSYSPQPKAPAVGAPKAPGGKAAELDVELCLQWREITADIAERLHIPPPAANTRAIADWLHTHVDAVARLDFAADILDTLHAHNQALVEHLGLGAQQERRYTTREAVSLLARRGVDTTCEAIRHLGRRGVVSVDVDLEGRRTYNLVELGEYYQREVSCPP